MSREIEQFNKEIDEFAKSIQDEAMTMLRKIVLEALRRLVMKTPVDTGRARGGWQVTIGSPAEGQTGKQDKEGRETIAKGLPALKDFDPYQIVWISNNVDYIEFLEHGSSEQAPAGMLAITVEELRTMFRLKKE